MKIQHIILPMTIIALTGCASIEQKVPANIQDGSNTTSTIATPTIKEYTPPIETNGVSTITIKGKKLTPAQVEKLQKLSSQEHGSIYFDFNQYTVKPEYYPRLEAHAQFMREVQGTVLLQGNTDEKGSREYNLSLGQKRAEHVKESLMTIGIHKDSIEAVSLGEEKASGKDSTDRRVDVLYVTDEQ